VQAVNASLADALSTFLPYYVVQMSIMGWMTNARVVPVMADVSQLIGAHSILRAVAAGLTRPVGQKFKVTAKGGDRNVRFVEWSLMKLLLVYLALTIISVIVAFGWNGGWSLQESSAIALFWSWYNVAILTVACLVCIEQPRKRKAERLQSDERVGVRWDKGLLWQPILDISTTGLRIEGPSPAELGQQVALQIGGINVQGTIMRKSEDDFAVRIDDAFEARKAMIRQVYSSRYNVSVAEVNPGQLVKGVLARVFR